jgi:hypothetical protein
MWTQVSVAQNVMHDKRYGPDIEVLARPSSFGAWEYYLQAAAGTLRDVISIYRIL